MMFIPSIKPLVSRLSVSDNVSSSDTACLDSSAPFQNRMTNPPALQSVTDLRGGVPDGVQFASFSHASIPTARSSLPSRFTSPIFSTAIPKCPLVMA